MLKVFEKLPSCLVGIEACGSAHHWARELTAIGHNVRLMPAAYVKPYVKRGKTDAVDAEAICEAVTQPTMRFVAVKSKEQQALLTIHRVRQLIVRQKTQMLNVIRGLLREYGHVVRNGPVAAMRFSETLKAYAVEMRETREIKAQEQANKLPVKMSGVMASLMLPALFMITLGPTVIKYIRVFGD